MTRTQAQALLHKAKPTDLRRNQTQKKSARAVSNLHARYRSEKDCSVSRPGPAQTESLWEKWDELEQRAVTTVPQPQKPVSLLRPALLVLVAGALTPFAGFLLY